MASPPLPPGGRYLPAAPPSNNMQRDFTPSHMPLASPPSIPNNRPSSSALSSNSMQRDFASSYKLVALSSSKPPRRPLPASANGSKPPTPLMMSFSFDPSIPRTQIPASINLSLPPPASVAFPVEKHPITVQTLKSAYSAGYVLHQDPAFRRDIQEFFGYECPGREPATKYCNYNDVPLVYRAADDDLMVWRAGTRAECGVEDGVIEDNVDDRVKSAEEKNQDDLLRRLRYKLFNDSH